MKTVTKYRIVVILHYLSFNYVEGNVIEKNYQLIEIYLKCFCKLYR